MTVKELVDKYGSVTSAARAIVAGVEPTTDDDWFAWPDAFRSRVLFAQNALIIATLLQLLGMDAAQLQNAWYAQEAAERERDR